MTGKYVVVNSDMTIEQRVLHPQEAENVSRLENVAAVVSVRASGMDSTIHVAYVDGAITQMAFDAHLGWVS